MSKRKTVIYSWPESQDCMNCANGEPVLTGHMDYICGASYKKPKTGTCPLFIERYEDEEN